MKSLIGLKLNGFNTRLVTIQLVLGVGVDCSESGLFDLHLTAIDSEPGSIDDVSGRLLVAIEVAPLLDTVPLPSRQKSLLQRYVMLHPASDIQRTIEATKPVY
ncbi:MAG: hypothetical protein ABW185_24940 [Sedimenticola sp.]